MSTSVGGIKIDTRILDKITAGMRPKAARIVEEHGFAITSETATGAPYETGYLMNTYLGSSKMTGELEFTIQDATTYGVFQELGTSKMAANPHLVPAVEHWRPRFMGAFMELFK